MSLLNSDGADSSIIQKIFNLSKSNSYNGSGGNSLSADTYLSGLQMGVT
jgi:hypothetical protein